MQPLLRLAGAPGQPGPHRRRQRQGSPGTGARQHAAGAVQVALRPRTVALIIVRAQIGVHADPPIVVQRDHIGQTAVHQQLPQRQRQPQQMLDVHQVRLEAVQHRDDAFREPARAEGRGKTLRRCAHAIPDRVELHRAGSTFGPAGARRILSIADADGVPAFAERSGGRLGVLLDAAHVIRRVLVHHMQNAHPVECSAVLCFCQEPLAANATVFPDGRVLRYHGAMGAARVQTGEWH